MRVCVGGGGGGVRKGAYSFRAKQMWTVPHNLTAGEVVLTTYMGVVVVLFLERPALLSAPRPQ